MLITDALFKALQIIEQIRKCEFVSCEVFSDGSGQIIDDNGNLILEWNDINKLEPMVTEYIDKKGKQ